MCEHVELPLSACQVARVTQQLEQERAQAQVGGLALQVNADLLNGLCEVACIQQFLGFHVSPPACEPATPTVTATTQSRDMPTSVHAPQTSIILRCHASRR